MRTIGFRVKSGFTIAVVLHDAAETSRIEKLAEVPLAIDAGKYGRFPYHPLIELRGATAVATSRRAVASVKSVARKNLTAFLQSMGAIDGAIIVVGSLIDPDRIGNPHIRVHAREGELFRTVVARALERRKIPHEFLRDKDTYSRAAAKLSTTLAQLRDKVGRMGQGVVKPWRADEKLAVAGALLAAASS